VHVRESVRALAAGGPRVGSSWKVARVSLNLHHLSSIQFTQRRSSTHRFATEQYYEAYEIIISTYDEGSRLYTEAQNDIWATVHVSSRIASQDARQEMA
jgi:hypothetical protein